MCSPLTRYLQKKLSGHPNIVQFCSAASIGKEESDTGQAEFLLLTELCRGKVPLGPKETACRHVSRVLSDGTGLSRRDRTGIW